MILMMDGVDTYLQVMRILTEFHETHNHDHWDFGIIAHSKAYIEAYRDELKRIFEKIYYAFPIQDIYFIHELEFRSKITGTSKNKIITLL